MESSAKKTNKKMDIFTIGFALFAMFFGAGNLIFPPYLGWKLGNHWFLGFLLYLAVDIGFSFVAMLVIAKSDLGSEAITHKLGKKLSSIIIAVICICVGPAIAIPRVAAITYEVGISPNFAGLNPTICMAIFFIIVWCLSISKSEVVDIVGKFLSPIMVIALLYMIVKGIIIPIGTISGQSDIAGAFYLGITSGYQTMDMMAITIFAITLLSTINQKGYTDGKSRFSMVLYSGVIAGALLFIVYGGLTYLGSTLHFANGHASQVDVLIAITYKLLGKNGLLLLGLVVALACLTTAIGLITSISEFFEEKTKWNYKVFVTIFTVISFIISNVGTNTIIQMASPVLNIVYPVLIFLTFVSVAGERIPIIGYFTGAGTAFIIALMQQIESIMHLNLISRYLPFNTYGFGWLIPAMVGLIIGTVIYYIQKDKK